MVPDWLTTGISVFVVIFLLELPDKTALATLLLATRHRPLMVFIGVALAFAVQSVVGVLAGSLLTLLPRDLVRVVAGLIFIGMAAVLVRRNLKAEEIEEEKEVEQEESKYRLPIVTSFMVIFVSEWADLSQLATAALQARYKQPVLVFTAATLALWTVSAIAIGIGNRLGALVPQKPLQYVAAGLMVVVGAALIIGKF
jgi:putative Ca2+/H+ antiporter (TMEM165/GDT1 family)